jgi:hypothetical protein
LFFVVKELKKFPLSFPCHSICTFVERHKYSSSYVSFQLIAVLSNILIEINVVIFLLQYFQRNTKLCDVNRRLKSQIWSSVVTIVLVEGKNLLPMDIDGFSDPYVKFRYTNINVTLFDLW